MRSSISLTLGANVEHLTLTGAAAINGTLSSTASSIGNTLTGNAAANVLRGGLGHDVIVGGLGPDSLIGGNGNDTLLPGAGFGVADNINGGAGFDTVDYRDALGGVTVMLTSGTIGGHATGDIIVGVQSVAGSRFNDILQASGFQFSSAFGGAGHDQIIGSAANYDRLRGDDGIDILSGHNGSNDDFWLQYDRGMDRVLTIVSDLMKTISSSTVRSSTSRHSPASSTPPNSRRHLMAPASVLMIGCVTTPRHASCGPTGTAVAPQWPCRSPGSSPRRALV